MAAPGLLGPSWGPDGVPPPIGVAELSDPLDFTLNKDDQRYLWWRFTAPEDGIYGFDTGLSTVGGSAGATSPHAEFNVVPVSPGGVGNLGSFPYEGSERTWVAVSMQAGAVVDLGLWIFSSWADWSANALRPVTVVLRSNDAGAVAPTPLATDVTLVASGTTAGGTFTLPAGVTIGDTLWAVADSRTPGFRPDFTLPPGVTGFQDRSSYYRGQGVRETVGVTVLTADVNTSAPGPLSVAYYGPGETVWAVTRGLGAALGSVGFTGQTASIGAAADGTGYAAGGGVVVSSPYTVYGPNGPQDPASARLGVQLTAQTDGTSWDPGYLRDPDGISLLHTARQGNLSVQLLTLRNAPDWRAVRPVPNAGQVHHIRTIADPSIVYVLTPWAGQPEPRPTRLYPRDDGTGLSAAPRLYPPPRSGRVIGGYI